MQRPPAQMSFLVFLIALVGGVVFFMLRPYLSSLMLAGAFAIVFRPLYRRLEHALGHYSSVAALITIFIILILVLAPLFFIASQLFIEALDLYKYLNTNGNYTDISQQFFAYTNSFFPGFSFDIHRAASQGINWVAQNVGTLFSSVVRTFINLFVTLVALFYFLRDGSLIKKTLKRLSPLSDAEDEIVIQKLEAAVNAVVRGSLLIAVIQGTLVGIGFALFGVSSPVLFGSLGTIAALIPGVGTSIIMIPGILYLFLTGSVGASIGLLAWGSLMVGLIDNFLGPIIINRGMKIHPLAVLLSVLGGLSLAGPIGFLLGPITLSLFVALIDIYLDRFTKPLSIRH